MVGEQKTKAQLVNELAELRRRVIELKASEVERKEMEEQLMRTEKLATIGQLASGVGHELRNPLGVISNSAYYLNSILKDGDEKVIKHVGIIQREVQRANKIITDLLDFSKAKPPSLEESDVNTIIMNTLDGIKVPENISVRTSLNGKLPRILLDPDQIRRVFLNIVSNALQAMPEGGGLDIKTGVKGQFAEITFKDTGEGIPEENIKKVFDPLFTTKAKGIGLGLSIVKGIVESHKGMIEVETEVGKGATFIVQLPVG
jgi:signal transduction histidine kinase